MASDGADPGPLGGGVPVHHARGAVGRQPYPFSPSFSESLEELLESSTAYIRHWMEVLQADSRAVVVAAARAQKAADYILGRQHHEEALPATEAA